MGAGLSKKRTMIMTLPEDVNFELSSFYRACRDNDIKTVKRLLSRMTFEQVNKTELNGQTAFFIATMNNNMHIVKLLRKHKMLLSPLSTQITSRTVHDIHSLSFEGLMTIDNSNMIERRIKFEENIRNDFSKIGIRAMLLNIQQHYIPLLRCHVNLSAEEDLLLQGFITEACRDCTPVPLVFAITLTPDIFQYTNRHVLQLVTCEVETRSLNLISESLQCSLRCLIGIFIIWPMLRSFQIRSRVQYRIIVKTETLVKYTTGMVIMVKNHLLGSTKWPLLEDHRLLKETIDDPSNLLVTCRYWLVHGENAKAVSLNELTAGRNPDDVLLLPLSLFVITKITRSSGFEVTINFVELPRDAELTSVFEPTDDSLEVRSSSDISSSSVRMKNAELVESCSTISHGNIVDDSLCVINTQCSTVALFL